MQRLFHISLSIGLIIIFLAALWTPAIAAPPAQDNAPVTLRIAMPAPDSLDPTQLSRFDLSTRDLVENLSVGLTRFNPQTQQADPMLAESWSVSEDGLIWTFNLRDDIHWVRYDESAQEVVSVRPVAAGDVVYAIQRACDPLRPSPVTANLMIVKGCHTVANAFPEIISDLFIAREIGVRATGPTTLEIEILFPASYLPSLLSTPEFRPLAREAVRASEYNWASTASLITNGPYALQAWDARGMTLVRNPVWPDPLAGNVERVEITYSGENALVSSLVSRGRVDLARLALDEIAPAQASFPDLVHLTEGTSLTVLGFSYDRALVSTPEIRRALAQSIDRDTIVEAFFSGQAQAATQFSPPGVVAAPTWENRLYNAAAAQSLYAAAGYEGCNNIPEPLIVLVPDDSPEWTDVAALITQQWSDVLGCSPVLFQVKPLPRTLMIELAHSAYDPEKVTRSHIWLTTWSADYLDANAWIVDALHCRYGYIRTGRECSRADDLMDRAAFEAEPTQRAELYAQAEELLLGPNGDFPIIPLFRSISAWMQQPWLQEVNEYGSARFDLWVIDADARPDA